MFTTPMSVAPPRPAPARPPPVSPARRPTPAVPHPPRNPRFSAHPRARRSTAPAMLRLPRQPVLRSRRQARRSSRLRRHARRSSRRPSNAAARSPAGSVQAANARHVAHSVHRTKPRRHAREHTDMQISPKRSALAATTIVLTYLLLAVPLASAEAVAPWWGLDGGVTADQSRHRSKRVRSSWRRENLGDAGTSGTVTIVDHLPAHIVAVGIKGIAGPVGHYNRGGPVTCVLKTLTCKFEDFERASEKGEKELVPAVIRPYEEIEIDIKVVVEPGAATGEENSATVSGGGVAQPVSATARHRSRRYRTIRDRKLRGPSRRSWWRDRYASGLAPVSADDRADPEQSRARPSWTTANRCPAEGPQLRIADRTCWQPDPVRSLHRRAVRPSCRTRRRPRGGQRMPRRVRDRGRDGKVHRPRVRGRAHDRVPSRSSTSPRGPGSPRGSVSRWWVSSPCSLTPRSAPAATTASRSARQNITEIVVGC